MPRNAVLPEPLVVLLYGIGKKLESGARLGTEVDECVDRLHHVDPRDLPRAEVEIVECAGLRRWRREPTGWMPIFRREMSHADQLRASGRLAFLFLLHRDGHLREAALRRIDGPIPSSFFLAAVAWRLNDWAAPVRAAAVDCAARCFPATPAHVIADAACALLPRQATWGRWDREADVLRAALERADVVSRIADRIRLSPTGPMASLLRQMLLSGSIDVHLERLSMEALQPAVRAAALQTLIRGHAAWPSGWQWRWIDKTMGIRRRDTMFDTRALDMTHNVDRSIRRGLRDRAAAVRSVAMAGLIEAQFTIADAASLASALRDDPSRAVRDRVAFVLGRERERR